MEDSGIFTALIIFNGELRDISYNVTVWEPLPIPTPVIEKTLDGNSSDLCHLHCSVPSNSPTLSYSWTYRDTGTDRLYANGSTITVSLKDKALGAEFTCWVQNPAHRNSTSVPLYPCGEAKNGATGRGYLLPAIIAISLIGVILVCIIIAVYIAVYKAVYSRRKQIMQRPAAPEHQADIKDGADEQIPLQEVLSTPASMVNSTNNRLSKGHVKNWKTDLGGKTSILMLTLEVTGSYILQFVAWANMEPSHTAATGSLEIVLEALLKHLEFQEAQQAHLFQSLQLFASCLDTLQGVQGASAPSSQVSALAATPAVVQSQKS
ncbi:uncharacterized protein LOC116406850 [Xenopus tropicalis]|uniref:Uncharacterized protein LOC116406850 n=1 Tax=Xenopus tropicalis TaxID=8364 RepID=A0A8J1ISF0_XENTR|nr:uncharacterized protein LOC116406850 [Xenopus tropicalis]